ncbi:MAG: YfhO family protein, partial [Chlorobiaceae bacterium]|nr:YfhO family protein [Chlorobiaceae bacterium]
SNVEVLRMLNVGYVISPLPLQHPAMKLVKTGHLKLVSGPVPVAVYELAGSRPRAWFAPWVAAVGSDKEAVASVMAGGGTQGGVFAAAVPWQGTKPFSAGTILSSTRSAESVSMKVRADGEAFLVLSEVFYPQRWKLSVDGRRQDAVKVDGLVRGVYVPAGEHQISFAYDRSRFETGRKISLAALLLSLSMSIGGLIAGTLASRTSKHSLKP